MTDVEKEELKAELEKQKGLVTTWKNASVKKGKENQALKAEIKELKESGAQP